jgi:hypothetical protein
MSGGFPLFPELCNCEDIGTQLSTTFGTPTTNGHGVMGSWTQLVAATAADAVAFDLSLIPPNNASTICAWDIGIGPAGSEQVIAGGFVSTSNTGGSNASFYQMPIAIPAGTRIAVRSDGNSSTDQAWCNLRLYEGDMGTPSCAGADAIGFNASTVSGVTVTGGAGAGVKGAYTQIAASTTRDYVGFVLNAMNASAADKYAIDIAIGPSGSEQVIISNLILHVTSASSMNRIAGPFFVPIPEGSRIAVRIADMSAGSETIDCILHGLYK